MILTIKTKGVSMLHRDHIFFIFLSFLSSVGYAGDVPKQPMTVEMVNNNPPTSPQMPDIEFQHNHVGGGSGKRRRADVGSSAGGSIFNFVTAFLRLLLKKWREIEK